MPYQLYVHAKSGKNVFQEEHLAGYACEHVHSSGMRGHVYLVRYRGEVIAGVGRVFHICYDGFPAAAEVRKSLPEFLYFGHAACYHVRLQVNVFDGRIVCGDIDGPYRVQNPDCLHLCP